MFFDVGPQRVDDETSEGAIFLTGAAVKLSLQVGWPTEGG